MERRNQKEGERIQQTAAIRRGTSEPLAILLLSLCLSLLSTLDAALFSIRSDIPFYSPSLSCKPL